MSVKSYRDYLRHISISRGSVAEIETEFLAAERLRYARRHDLGRLYTFVTM